MCVEGSTDIIVDSNSSRKVESENGYSQMAKNIFKCITSYPKRLHTSLGYYSKGSEIFEKICELPEYYPNKVEKRLLYRSSYDIIKICKPNSIIDLGCGNMEKTQIILHEAVKFTKVTLYGCDVVSNIIYKGIENLNLFYRHSCSIKSHVSDLLNVVNEFNGYKSRNLFTFFGSTYGNLSEEERKTLLRRLSKNLRVDDYFLIGIDLVKDRSIIEPAYNDSMGLTAQGVFEMLVALNEQFDAQFDLNSFEYEARFEPEFRRAASYLISKRRQSIPVRHFSTEIALEKGEEIQAEIYQKFVLSEVLEFIQSFGLRPVKIEVDDEIPYALLLFSGPKDNAPAPE